MTHHSSLIIHHSHVNAISNRLSLRPPQRDSLVYPACVHLA